MSHRVCCFLLPLILATPVLSAADTPEPNEIVDRMIAAAGGEAFASIGILELVVTEEEIRRDGSRGGKSYSLLVDTTNVMNLRMEIPGDVVVAGTKGGGWSTVKGVLDDRRQTVQMARRTLNQTAFTLLLPFSLRMEGVWAKEVREAVIDGREVWVMALPFAKGFFVNPILTTDWIMVVARDDYSLISIEFAPSKEFHEVAPAGIRYRYIKEKDVGGAKIAEQVLAVSIDQQFQDSGATRVTKIASKVRPWDATLFLSPARLEALEKDD